MKKILTYTLLAACILALSACSQKQLDPPAPEIEVDETAPISFSTGVAGTKGLIGGNEGETALENANTIIQVYDYLTSTDGNTTVEYINDKISGVANPNPWNYIDVNTHYYWTKTGTHKFFGYLTTDPAGTAFSGASMANQVLTVGPLMMSADDPQVDFLYSDIKSYTMPARPATQNGAVDLSMSHLFTALQVQVSNQTGDALSNFGVKFTGFLNNRKATINYSGNTVPETDPYSDGGVADFPFGPQSGSMAADATAFTSLYTADPYRLLWPQTITANTKVVVSYSVNVTVGGESKTINNTISASLLDIFKTPRIGTDGEPVMIDGELVMDPVNAMEAGHKYCLKIKVLPTEVWFTVLVDPLDEKYYDGQGDNATHSDYLIKLI